MKVDSILYIGSLKASDTSQHRMNAMQQLGFKVVCIDTSLYLPQGLELYIQYYLGIGRLIDKLNKKIVFDVMAYKPDIVWVDKGIFVKKETLRSIRSLTKTVHLNPDDPFGLHRNGWRIFLKALPFYDLHFVSRPQNVEEYASVGAKKVFEYDRSFSPHIHKPYSDLEMHDVEKFDVGFIGSYAPQRSRSIEFLLTNNIAVRVFGSGWKRERYPKRIQYLFHGPLTGVDYSKTLNAMKIALHFLRRENRDEQDSRTFEIPASGTFMLAERSRKHEQLFSENQEAVFFDSDEELLHKVRQYLKQDEKRIKIATAGLKKSWDAGYDHCSRLKQLLNIVKQELTN